MTERERDLLTDLRRAVEDMDSLREELEQWKSNAHGLEQDLIACRRREGDAINASLEQTRRELVERGLKIKRRLWGSG